MIHIVVKEDKVIFNLGEGKGDEEIGMGAEFIRTHGFPVVDEIVDMLTLKIKGNQVVVEGKTLESKMIARKLEDKIKREVGYLEN